MTALAPVYLASNTVCVSVYACVYVWDFPKLYVWTPAYKFVIVIAKERVSQQEIRTLRLSI